MLFLDKKQITAQELAAQFGVPIDKIEKAPVYEINPNRKVPDPLNKTFKTPYGKGMMAVFFARDPKTKRTYEIRYADSINNERVGDKLIEKYSPLKVNFRGKADLKTDIDEAVYFYLHPQHQKSPFRLPNAVKPWFFTFVDNTARAEDLMGELTVLADAMNHVKRLSETRLRILAKGMGIKNVDSREFVIVQSELMMFAKNNPQVYLDKADRQTTLFDGMIQDAIDKDVFHLENKSGIRRWTWNAGPRIGEHIVDIVNVTQDSNQVLVNHIKANINEFFNDLQNVTTTLRSKQVAENFLENQDMSFLDNDDDDDDEPDNGEERMSEREYERQVNQSPLPRYTPTTRPQAPQSSFLNDRGDDILPEDDDDDDSPIYITEEVYNPPPAVVKSPAAPKAAKKPAASKAKPVRKAPIK